MNDKILLIGCGILRTEVRSLIQKNGWPVEARFLNSSLHCELGRLSGSLQAALAAHRDRHLIVFYGCCHPRMDDMLDAAGAFRTEGQNCVEMLLGQERFSSELEQGAFFLLEDWARKWETVLKATFGTDNINLIHEMFQSGDRQYILAVRTPCSNDFQAEAKAAAKTVNLPLRWLDVNLDHLEVVMRNTVEKKMRELQWMR